MASAFGEEKMDQIDRMLLRVGSNLEYQSQDSAFSEDNISSELQNMFQEANINTAKTLEPCSSELEQNANIPKETSYHVNTFVSEQFPLANISEPLNDAEWLAFPLPQAQANLSSPTGTDEQELSISGAVHSALATIYEETEHIDVEILQPTFQNEYQESISMADHLCQCNDRDPSGNIPVVNYEIPETSQTVLTSVTANESQYQLILSHLQRDENASKKNSWNKKTANDLENILHIKESACKTLTVKELKICNHALKEKREKLGIKFCNSWTK